MAAAATNIKHVAIFCSPGAGHLTPLAAFAEQLVAPHHFAVTLIAIVSSETHLPILETLTDSIRTVLLSPPPQDPDTNLETRIYHSITHNLPQLRAIFHSLAAADNLPVALVVDSFSTAAFDVAEEFGVSPYLFNTTSCLSLFLAFRLQELDAAALIGEFTGLLQMPGCRPINDCDLPGFLRERPNQVAVEFFRSVKRYREARGILLNSFEALEPEAAMALRGNCTIPPVYLVGPLIRSCSNSESDAVDCLNWLARQPTRSVLYVCFGSSGTLSSKQMTELAWGLVMSRHRFLWVANIPHDEQPNSAFFGDERKKKQSPLEFLPDRFLERTKDIGLVVTQWAPQVEVLGHVAVGGFLSHCGWNSTLESIVNGVPMITWPLFAEQKINATALVEDMKVAVRAGAGEHGLVEREGICKAIKCLMEFQQGEELRCRIDKLRNAAKQALSADGSSSKSILELVKEWKK